MAGNEKLIDEVKANFPLAPITDKRKALLTIAGSMQKGGKQVTSERIDRPRSEGATNKDIQNTVLIARAFCMYNRYVDGLQLGLPPIPKRKPAKRQAARRSWVCSHNRNGSAADCELRRYAWVTPANQVVELPSLR
jgi:hypothetical protein